MVDLRDLALFVATVEQGSITAGADAVAISLPAASARISSMERHYDTALLHRGRRGVTPTATGEVLLDHARRVLGAQHDLERRMLARRRGLAHVVHLEVNTSALDALTEVLAAALASSPDTEIVLSESRSTQALDHIGAGTADLAVVSDAPDHTGLQSHDLWDDPLVAVGLSVAAPGGDTTSGPVTLHDLVSRPMIGLVDGSPLQTLIEEAAFTLGAAPTYRLRLPSLPAVCAVASTGAGVAIVPTATARRLGLPASAINPLDEPWARRRALLVARDFDDLPGPVSDLAATLLRHRHETW